MHKLQTKIGQSDEGNANPKVMRVLQKHVHTENGKAEKRQGLKIAPRRVNIVMLAILAR